LDAVSFAQVQQPGQLNELPYIAAGQPVLLGQRARNLIGDGQLLQLALVAADGEASLLVGVIILQMHHCPRVDRVVDGRALIGGEEADAVQRFQKPEEHPHDRILDDVFSALAHVDVGLVDEQDGIPSPGTKQCFAQVLFDFRRLDAKLRALDFVQRTLVFLSEDLGAQCLPQAWVASDDYEAPSGLATDDVPVGEMDPFPEDLVQSSRRTAQMFLEVEHRHISEKDRHALFLACQGQQDKTPELKRLQRQLKSLLDIAKNPKGTKVQTLGAFKDALTLLLKELPNKWVYRFDKELRRWAPYFVERIKESSPTRYGLPSVDLEMAAVLLGERTEEKTYFHNCDIRGKTMAHILEDAGIRTETHELNAEFQEHLDLFHKYTKKKGEQFTAVAWVQTRESENNWQPEVYHVPVDPERPAQLVMDHTSIARPSKDELHADASFWEEQADYDQETSTEKGDEAISLPEHPIVYMYDLQAHEEVIVHIADIAPYKYQTEIGKLLVLPKDEKRLLEVLIFQSAILQQGNWYL